MTDKKFTKEDVVVGATVTTRETMRDDRHKVSVVRTYGPDVVTATGYRYIHFEGGATAYLCDYGTTTVEILDVQPPKPEYVVGGIYPITEDGATHLRVRHEGGWGLRGNVASRATFWRDDENYIHEDMVGDRVLVIPYPSNPEVILALSEDGDDSATATALIARALKAEAR